MVWERELNSYGATRDEKGLANFIPFKYQGQYYDNETGLAYNRFRYYDPGTGNYISQDPIRLNSYCYNLYKYVSDTNFYIDAFGLSGECVKFKKWRKGDAIDKPMPDGTPPSWNVVRNRYWKNRYEASKNSKEFTKNQLDRMKQGKAPKDYNPRVGKYESRELHHVDPQREGGNNGPINLREVTPDQHAAMDPYRHTGSS